MQPEPTGFDTEQDSFIAGPEILLNKVFENYIAAQHCACILKIRWDPVFHRHNPTILSFISLAGVHLRF